MKKKIEDPPFDKILPLTKWQKKLLIAVAIKMGLSPEDAKEIYDAPTR
jgi:hypothetical protein